jgi:DNA-binding MarR family transcriptional regulator
MPRRRQPVADTGDGMTDSSVDTATDEALLAVARLVVDVSVRAADELGALSPVQLRALTVLRSSSGANLATLADSMGVAVSTASRLVDRLTAAEWVHRETAPHTRREVSLTLTDGGEELLRRYDERRLAELRGCIDQLAAGRRDAVVAALAEFGATTPAH